MARFFLTVLVNALAILITAWLLPGIHVVNNDIGTYILIGLVFGLVNAFIKPIITLLSCAFILLTFGLFLFVVNGLMLWITASLLSDRLIIDNFWWAILGGIIMAILGGIIERLFGINNNDDDNNPQVIVYRQ